MVPSRCPRGGVQDQSASGFGRERLTGEAFVLKEARTLTVKAAARALSGERATLVAMMMQTNMRMRLESEGRFDVKSPKIASHNSVANP
jgi:hypothetical protein